MKTILFSIQLLFCMGTVASAINCSTSFAAYQVSLGFETSDNLGRPEADDDPTLTTCNPNSPSFCLGSFIFINDPRNQTVIQFTGCLSDFESTVGGYLQNSTYAKLLNPNCDITLPAGKNDTSLRFAMAYNCCKTAKCDAPDFEQVHWEGSGVSATIFSIGFVVLTTTMFRYAN